MTRANNFVFWVLYVIIWLIFIGVSIEAGGLLVNFVFSVFKPEMVQNLYQKLDLTDLYANSKITFFTIYGFLLSISILKAVMFYVVIHLMHKMDLKKPFDTFVSRQISRISYYTIAIGLLSFIGWQIANSLLPQSLSVENLNPFWADSEAFIFTGAVIYIIAVIFKKGVDIQNENDLTV